MRFSSTTVRWFIAIIFLAVFAVPAECGDIAENKAPAENKDTSQNKDTTENKGTPENKPVIKIPPGFEIVKGSAEETNGWASEIRHKDTGIEMVYVAPGDFMMGSPPSEKGRVEREILHKVKLTKAFYIGKYEVTQGQWEKAMGHNPSSFKGVNLPVEKVSWENCMSFCKKLGAGFRLPTEAEWEYAARGGNRSKGFIYSGSNNLDEVGWYASNTGKKTHEVGKKKANELGIYDMSGNVWEWCSDWYGNYPVDEATDPIGVATGSGRVVRGGGWYYSTAGCRSAYRRYGTPLRAYDNRGFRIASTAAQ